MKRLKIIVALISGLLAAIVGWAYISGLEEKYESCYKKIPVAFAKSYIEQDALIVTEDIEIREIPSGFAQPAHFKCLAELAGEKGESPKYVTSCPVLKDEQIVGTKLIRVGSETGISAVVPAGRRAFTIICQKTSIKGILIPGNRIDVLTVVEDYSLTILQNIAVLSVARRLENVPNPNQTKGESDSRFNIEDTEEYVPVTLAVSPQEAQVLALASERGKIHLSLRPLGDRTTVHIAPVEMGKIVKGLNIKVAEASAYNGFVETLKKKYDDAANIWKQYK